MNLLKQIVTSRKPVGGSCGADAPAADEIFYINGVKTDGQIDPNISIVEVSTPHADVVNAMAEKKLICFRIKDGDVPILVPYVYDYSEDDYFVIVGTASLFDPNMGASIFHVSYVCQEGKVQVCFSEYGLALGRTPKYMSDLKNDKGYLTAETLPMDDIVQAVIDALPNSQV